MLLTYYFFAADFDRDVPVWEKNPVKDMREQSKRKITSIEKGKEVRIFSANYPGNNK